MDQDSTVTESDTTPTQTEPQEPTPGPTPGSVFQQLANLEYSMETRRAIETHTHKIITDLISLINMQTDEIGTLRGRLDALEVQRQG